MEKILKLYTYIDGINDTPFPNEEYQVVTSNFRSDYKRMGGAPSITCTIMHTMCLDKLWTYGVYAKFNGERFFIKQIPSSSYDNTDARYKHELELVSERIILDNVYVYDVVDSASVDDKPVSNNSKFTFFGTVNEFAQRLNQSLRYSGLDYTIVVDDGITSDGKLVSFENQFFTNALQEIYNIFELPYYFVGKVIHIGYTSNAITHTFKYGQDESLLSIQKQNANHKIVNRVTGVGSADNIPYYYPNDDEKGESKPLYNNNEDVAYVSDVNKYKKVKLYDIFKYVNQSSYTTTIIDTDDYRNVSIHSFIIVDKLFKHDVSVEYKLAINEGGNVTFFLHSDLSETKSLRYLVWRLGVNESYGMYSDNERVIVLTAGEYAITLSWTIENDKTPMAMEEELESLVKNNLTFYATRQHGYDVDTWTIEGKNISLSSYGISLNTTPKNGDTISFKRVGYIKPQTNLMPSIYRETSGNERFYNALNGTYVSPHTGDYYHFNNPYIEGKPKEHIVNFEDIKPSIVGMTNSNGLRIDMFIEFAYDANDNDETDEEGKYLHPYFFGRLRRFDGTYGFNLFDHSIDEEEMVISMTSGSCGACEFIIVVDDESQKNLVQVDKNGNLLRDEQGNVRCGREGMQKEEPQEAQNDTRNNEVWIALKKDINTFGVIMPNATHNYRPSIGDTFVILHIDLPKAYILAAEDKLKEELIKYMAMNNSEKFNFSITFSRIFFAENPQVLSQLNENARIQIEYDNERYELYVSSFSYAMSNEQSLPEIRVELSDTISVQQNALQNAISEVKQDIMSSVGSVDFLQQGLRYFLRKDTSDRTRGKLSSDVGFEVGKYVSGASGAIIYKDSSTGQTIGELDKLYVRMKAYFETLVISEVDTISGKQIISPAGSIKCIGVDEIETAYRCYFLGVQDGSETTNLFRVNDQAYSQTFNAKQGEYNKISNTYYWRLITDVSKNVVTYKNQKCHYIDLSKTDCDNGSAIPKEGDIINHRGSRTELDRMNFIEMSSVDAFSPNITLFHGVNSYSLDGKAYVSYGVDKSTNKAFMEVYGDMYVGDRQGGSYMRYTQEKGLEISGTLSVGTKLGDKNLQELIESATPEGYQDFVEKVTQDIEGLQNQIDGVINSYFYQYEPTLDNYPASEWIANGEEKAHLNDTFTNLSSGHSWRWTFDDGAYKWTEIADTATTKALVIAGQAKDTADGKRRVFVSQPFPPYDLGDLWAGGKDTFLMYCVHARETGIYDPADWDYADSTQKISKELSTFDYLKASLNESTSIEGGLIQSSLLMLGYTDSQGKFNVMSGTNGIYDSNSHGGGVASWWGGELHDLLDYYTWNGDTWIPKAGMTIPTNIPSGLIRMDGTGYLAKGKFWWDNNGKIYADPTALFLMFDVEDEAKSLSATILTMLDKQKEFEDMWMVKTDNTGIKYLYSKYPIVTQYGFTMYGDATTLNIPSIYNGLPIDGDTIYWEGGYLKAKGGGSTSGATTLGGLSNVGTWADSVADVDRIMYQAAGSSNWVAKSLSSIGGGGGGDYLPLSGGILSDVSKRDLLTLNTENNAGPTLILNVSSITKAILGVAPSTNYGAFWTYVDGNIALLLGHDGKPYFSTDIERFTTRYELLHSGNYSSYALPLTGGTLSGNLIIGDSSNTSSLGLILNRSGREMRVATTDYRLNLIYKSTEDITTKLVIGDNFLYYYYNSTPYKIWHGGNDGSGSGLDADLLDGKHLSDIYMVNSSADLGGSTSSPNTLIVRYTNTSATANHPYDIIGGNQCIALNLYAGDNYAAQLAVGFGGDGYLAFRRKATSTTWSKWSKIRSGYSDETGKLTTARTIWGQSFDGTENVSGNLSNVYGIVMNNTSGGKYGFIDFHYNGASSLTSNIYEVASGQLKINEVLVVNRNGNVGIGTTSPSQKLSVNGRVQCSGMSALDGIELYHATPYIDFHHNNSTSDYTLRLIENTAGILTIQGSMIVSGGITMYSDQRKKTILNHVELSLKQIANAPLIEHYYNSDDKRTTHVGSIAQYWANMNDWFCKLDNEGFYTMEIQNCALASAISIARELDRYESKTDKTIKQLKKRICQLEEEIERLKSA